MGFWPWEVGFKCPAEGLSFTQPGTSEHARRGGAWPDCKLEGSHVGNWRVLGTRERLGRRPQDQGWRPGLGGEEQWVEGKVLAGRPP